MVTIAAMTVRSSDYALAIETSCDRAGVALGRGKRLIAVVHFERALRNASAFIPSIAEVCQRESVAASQISEVYVSCGPGSFTGLRLGIAAARTLAWAVGAKVVSVPTLDVIAQNALILREPPSVLAVVVDAKRAHVYANVFLREADRYRPTLADAEVSPAALGRFVQEGGAIIGPAVEQYQEILFQSGWRTLPEIDQFPQVEWVYRLGQSKAQAGQFTPLRELVPLYIRPSEAEERWEQRHRPPTR